MKLHPKAQKFTSFGTDFGHHACTTFGHVFATEIFQRKMKKLLMSVHGIMCHIHDILVHVSHVKQHDRRQPGIVEITTDVK